MPGDDHLRQLSPRESFSLLCNIIDDILINALHTDQLLAMIDASWVLPKELGSLHCGLGRLAILHEVVKQHSFPFVLVWKVEPNDFVHTIVNGLIKLIGVVSGHHKNHLFTWTTCPVEE